MPDRLPQIELAGSEEWHELILMSDEDRQVVCYQDCGQTGADGRYGHPSECGI